MTLKIYNTLTKEKQEFIPIQKNEIKFYSCGPTVYNYAHIGNLRTYIFNDLLKRVLEYNNYKVTHVMNITDVGHLTDDADSGEDKMEKGAKREGKTVWEVAQFYTDAFISDIKKLNIKEPTTWCKATEHIQEMIDMIQKIEQKGYTYLSGGNLYYDTSKFKDYAVLGNLNLEDDTSSRVELDQNKKHPRDFVLWFGLGNSKFGTEHSMKWESPWGTGYPGWHIECCAMSSKYLGNKIDIHTGGIDHIQVHHTNEIAQAEVALDVHPWVNYWLHANFLVIDKGKMAKSGENFLKLGLLEQKGYEPLAYRYFCLNAHYKSELKFTWESLDSAKNGYNNFKKKIIEIKNNSKEGSNDATTHIEKFENAINDDLNIPVALATAWDVLNSDISNKIKYETLLKFDTVLGLDIKNMNFEKINVPEEIEILAKKRLTAKQNKDYKLADELRDEIKAQGYFIEDTKEGYNITKI